MTTPYYNNLTQCNQSIKFTGTDEIIYSVKVNSGTGDITLFYNNFMPCRYVVYDIDDNILADTSYVGDKSYQDVVSVDIIEAGSGTISFTKESEAEYLNIKIYCPLPSTVGLFKLSCLQDLTPVTLPPNTTPSPTPIGREDCRQPSISPTPTPTMSRTPARIVSCGDAPIYQSGPGIYTYRFNSGIYTTGQISIAYNTFFIPDRFTLIYNNKITSSGFVGDISYNSALTSLGYPEVVGPGQGAFTYNIVPNLESFLYVEAPLNNTEFLINLVCPTPTPSVTKTPIYVSPTPTKTSTITPTVTKTSTRTPTVTKTVTKTPGGTSTPTNTKTPTLTPSTTITRTPGGTPPPTESITPTRTVSNSVSPTNTRTPTVTPTPSGKAGTVTPDWSVAIVVGTVDRLNKESLGYQHWNKFQGSSSDPGSFKTHIVKPNDYLMSGEKGVQCGKVSTVVNTSGVSEIWTQVTGCYTPYWECYRWCSDWNPCVFQDNGCNSSQTTNNSGVNKWGLPSDWQSEFANLQGTQNELGSEIYARFWSRHGMAYKVGVTGGANVVNKITSSSNFISLTTNSGTATIAGSGSLDNPVGGTFYRGTCRETESPAGQVGLNPGNCSCGQNNVGMGQNPILQEPESPNSYTTACIKYEVHKFSLKTLIAQKNSMSAADRYQSSKPNTFFAAVGGYTATNVNESDMNIGGAAFAAVFLVKGPASASYTAKQLLDNPTGTAEGTLPERRRIWSSSDAGTILKHFDISKIDACHSTSSGCSRPNLSLPALTTGTNRSSGGVVTASADPMTKICGIDIDLSLENFESSLGGV